MKTRYLCAFVLCAAVAGAGCAIGDEAELLENQLEDHAAELTGGTAAAPGQFPGTLHIGGCTAAKVGPRHILTAAHCVVNDVGQINADLRPGATMRVTSEVNPAGTHRPIVVRRTVVHPSWVPGSRALREPVPADAAVIEVEGGLEAIPTVPIDLTTLAPGTPVILQGYGCENGLRGGGSPPRLKYFQTRLVDASVLASPEIGPHAGEAAVNALRSSYSITPGKAINGAEASLCPGDSGGPMYAQPGGQLAVVGINAYYSFLSNDRQSGVAAYNWLTRLDATTRHLVAQWLINLGVSVRAIAVGSAKDIGIGSNGSVWSIGSHLVGGGDYTVYQRNGSGWLPTDGYARHVSVGPDGAPWVVKDNGEIYRRIGGRWQRLPGLGRDIGVGADGTAWLIGLNPMPGGFGVFRWSGSNWTQIDGGATRIAVTPAGTPWVVNDRGQVFNRGPSGWQLLPGLARDIGAGASGAVWLIGANPVPGGFGVFRWNGSNWTQIDGGATRIAVSPTGAPWVVNDLGDVYSREGQTWQRR